MRVHHLQAGPGEHVFGFLEVEKGRSGLEPKIPVHLFSGVEQGPTLLVQAAIHGNEVIATAAILRFVKKLDPKQLRGNVVAVPVVNRIGFELAERLNRVDGKDISRLFPGNPRGSLSDQIAYSYFHEVISRANAMIEFHAGGLTGYERYVLFTADKDPNNPTEIEQKRKKLVVAFGLDTAAFFPPGMFGTGEAEEAIARAGVVMFQPEIGGGTGWFANGEANIRDAERGVWNTMKAMGMIGGSLENDGPLCTIYNANEVLWKPGVDGLFVRKRRFGERLQAGEVYAILQHPYTGQLLAEMRTAKEATVIPSGQEWLTVGSTSIGILGVVHDVADRRTMDVSVNFDQHIEGNGGAML